MNTAATQNMPLAWNIVRPQWKSGRCTAPEPAPTGPHQHTEQVNALAIVAHDLRGPLASISALMELIDMHGERQSRERISNCTKRAMDIVECLDDMLNSILERVKETGDPLGYRPSHVDINAVLRKAATLNRPTAEDNTVALQVDAAAPLMLWGDDRLLLQAVENLIGNAVKHTRTGGSVCCRAKRHDQQVIIRITDQGKGFSELDLQRAFRPFTKLSAKSSMAGRSWGLGLWIVRLIVERHGGRIDVSPAGLGGGTVFSLSLPV